MGGGTKKRASAAQLRITKDINELELPKTCKTEFPDVDDLLNFKLIIYPDEGFYRHGQTPVHLQFQDWCRLPSRTSQGQVRDESVSPQHRPGRECLFEHSPRGLETSSHD